MNKSTNSEQIMFYFFCLSELRNQQEACLFFKKQIYLFLIFSYNSTKKKGLCLKIKTITTQLTKKRASRKSPKIQVSKLSQQMLDCIRHHQWISDQDLMDLLYAKFPTYKQQNISRRKYDIIKVLQNSNVIQVNRSGIASYGVTSSLPNSHKDVNQYKNILQLKREQVARKKQLLLVLQTTKKNYQKLFTENKQREVPEENKIALPIVVCSRKFTEYQRTVIQDEKMSETVYLRFPTKTMYINNILALTKNSK